MEIRFEKTGAERKALVAAISEVTGEASKYLGAPGFAYRVGGYVISMDGAVDTGVVDAEDVSALLAALATRGFVPADTPGLCVPASEDSPAPEAGESGATPAAMCIELPAEGLTDADVFDNLKKLAAGKAALIRRALGNDLAEGAKALPITLADGKVGFPWFRFGMDADSIAAWSIFAAKLCVTAKTQKRVILKEKPLREGDSEKFAMRCFLLKLGFIGDEYKEARKVILAGLPGDGSHKTNGWRGKKNPIAADEPVESSGAAEGLHNDDMHPAADDSLVRGGLCCVPPTDGNYTSYLHKATDEQLRQAIAQMESVPAGNTGRITACKRELKRRSAVS